MKYSQCLAALLFIVSTGWATLAQTIPNAGFDMPRDTNRLLPASWGIRPMEGYLVTLDSTIASGGGRSLKIASTIPTPPGFQGFSQQVPVQLNRPAIVHLRATTKTEKPASIALWCQIWDDKKMVGFANSEMQASVPDSSGEWRDLDLHLTVMPETKRFVFGGYLKGQGTVWFDNVRFETASANGAEPSAAVKAYLNKAVALVKKHALIRDSIPWAQTEANMLALAAGMQTEQEAHTVMGYLLDVMRKRGDNHSHFQRPVAVKQLHAATPVADAPKPEGRYLGEGVGYVLVPRFWGINGAREADFSTAIQTIIKAIDTAQTTSGWVVDLRQNQGGNMWPMLAGLRPLIGEGTLGYFVNGDEQNPWSYDRSTGSKATQRQRLKTSYTLRTSPARIAVLIGPQTSSSGEFTALSFIGSPNVRTFGLHSGGYTTANQSFLLPDGAELYLAVSVAADRTGKKYPHGIAPDEEVKRQPNNSDPTLAAARAWLAGGK